MNPTSYVLSTTSGLLLSTQLSFGSASTAVPFKQLVQPFFAEHCVRCHGPDKVKGKITLHSLDGDLAEGQDLERWETILDMLESGEMPPEDEPQPNTPSRKAVAAWIESSLRDAVIQAN